MALIDVKVEPSRKDLVVFSLMWLAFFLVLGCLAVWHRSENTLLHMAGFAGCAVIFSLMFNADFPRRAQLIGATIPAALLAIWGLESTFHVEPWNVFATLAVVGVLGLVCTFVSHTIGRSLYRGWMFAAMPIGWTMSAVLMGFVYFLVVTPLGLIMRLAGKDPMCRRFDRSLPSYWLPHRQEADPKRYFRQF